MEVTREHRSRPLTDFGSEGAEITFLGERVVAIELRKGGRVARHPAVGEQLLIVVRGKAKVSGADAVFVEVGRGDVVRWAAGEEHETVARSAFVAIVVE